MSKEWYDRIAGAQGGYLETWTSKVEGLSGEDVFTERLFALLKPHMKVLDAGCGSGEFTLNIAPYVRHVIGFDFAWGMLEVAQKNVATQGSNNIAFIHASTRALPFEPCSFDLIYSRRGPTSIVLTSNLLKPGGILMGIHSGNLDKVKRRLEQSQLRNVTVDEFTAVEHFPTLQDLGAFCSRFPGHPDYLAVEREDELLELADKYRTLNGFSVPQRRFVWQGKNT